VEGVVFKKKTFLNLRGLGVLRGRYFYLFEYSAGAKKTNTFNSSSIE
jgi:hypothetical protein